MMFFTQSYAILTMFHIGSAELVWNMEDWMSGLNQQFTKLSSEKLFREFESHILRIDNLLVL
jgi:hypothetical protein